MKSAPCLKCSQRRPLRVGFVRQTAVALAGLFVLLHGGSTRADVMFERFSAYHHIQVVDEGGLRTLRFNTSRETRMSLANPLQGHFEYTEYFHMPWLWNTNIERVLMAGLGGGSTQRAYQHYYTNVVIDTVELDPVVVSVAQRFFGVTETPKHAIHTEDARVFLRRATNTYDAILMDAYSTSRYGSSLPPHLTTKEFFTIAKSRLSENGVLAYNVIGQIRGWRSGVVGAMCRTLEEVFPKVYLFPAVESQNIVLVATRSSETWNEEKAQRAAADLIQSGRVTLPTFRRRLQSFVDRRPASFDRAPILTDDYAPIERILQGDR